MKNETLSTKAVLLKAVLHSGILVIKQNTHTLTVARFASAFCQGAAVLRFMAFKLILNIYCNKYRSADIYFCIKDYLK